MPDAMPRAELQPLADYVISSKDGLKDALRLLPDQWKQPPVLGETFINLDAAMDRIKGYGLWCGFASDCFNPMGTTSFKFQCAHAMNTVQFPQCLNNSKYCANTRDMKCPFTLTIKRVKKTGVYEICEYCPGTFRYRERG
jgi:hypothetical protein